VLDQLTRGDPDAEKMGDHREEPNFAFGNREPGEWKADAATEPPVTSDSKMRCADKPGRK
jgi:hypothetical protein